jgi:hypothetical protein
MENTSRWVAVVVALGSVCMGCGGDDPEPSGGASGSESSANEPSDPEALDFDITGRSAPMTGRAELKVNEGERAVHVAITGRTPGTDFVTIDLSFDGLDAAIGPHHVEFSLPAGGASVVVSSLDDTSYYSQGGNIDVSLGADGRIEGSFDVELAPGTLEPAPGEETASAASAVSTELEGTFNGAWVLNCRSRLMGHSSLISGGNYCDTLVFSE